MLQKSPAYELSAKHVGWIGGGYLSMLGSLAGQTVFISLFGSQIRQDFGISSGEYGLAYTAATLCSAVMLVFLGSLTDRFSPRFVAAGSLLGLACACVAMYFSTSLAALIVSLFGLRLCGQGMLSHNSATALARWFNRFRGRALAISQFGYSTGEALLPVVVTLAIAAFGWRDVWLLVAAVLVLVFMPAIGLLFRGPFTPAAKPSGASGAAGADAGWTRGRVLRDGLFWLVLTGVLANPAIVTLIFFHQAELVASKGWDPLLFVASFPILSVTSAIAGIAGGALLDRFGAWRLLPYILLPLGLANLVLWMGSAPWTIWLFFFLTGLSAGWVNGVVTLVWAELYGTAHLGAVRAVATAGLVFASAAGPGIAGVLIDLGMPLENQCLYYAIYCALASLTYVAIQGRVGRRVRETASIPA